jgi:hypothetical protein
VTSLLRGRLNDPQGKKRTPGCALEMGPRADRYSTFIPARLTASTHLAISAFINGSISISAMVDGSPAVAAMPLQTDCPLGATGLETLHFRSDSPRLSARGGGIRTSASENRNSPSTLRSRANVYDERILSPGTLSRTGCKHRGPQPDSEIFHARVCRKAATTFLQK